MLVTKVNGGYEFASPPAEGALKVKLVLDGDREEKLVTELVGLPISFEPRDLEPGTIRRLIGEECWQQFLRMKELGFDTLILEPPSFQRTGVTSTKMTS
jgi:hypothetical protein